MHTVCVIQLLQSKVRNIFRVVKSGSECMFFSLFYFLAHVLNQWSLALFFLIILNSPEEPAILGMGVTSMDVESTRAQDSYFTSDSH